MCGAQLGKSEMLLNLIGYHIDLDPTAILMLQPTLEMAQRFSKKRIANGLLRATPCLRTKVRDPRSRDANNTTLSKEFQGGHLHLVGSNSSAGISSDPIRLVLCDEVDRFPPSAGTEGDPISLARKRSVTYWNRKTVLVSTPTHKDASRISDAFELSDKRFYFVPCPHCDHEQKLNWKNVIWTDDDPNTAGYSCESCGVLWNESERLKAIRGGRWEASAISDGIAGFAISGLYSPWTPLADGVREFLACGKNPEMLRVWTNTYLGETWEDEGEGIDELFLASRREDWGTLVPEEAVLLVSGVDVQDNRLECTTLAIGRDDEQWVIDHRAIYGDPASPTVWKELDLHIFGTFKTHGDQTLKIRATCVDSGGHHTQTVYKYCKERQNRRVFAIKGVPSGEGKPLVGRPSKNNSFKCLLFPVSSDSAKDLIFARLRLDEVGPGYIHFAESLDDEYFMQLTAEKVVTRFSKGFKRRVYQKFRPRNESLDCLVYSYCAYAIMNLNVNLLADKRDSQKADEEKSGNEPPPRSHGVSGFVNSWR